MPPPLPPTSIGWTLGAPDAKVNLGSFLDYTGTVCHEAAMAVGKLGGTDAFFAFSDELFKVAPDQFYDIYTFDKTRNQMIDELAALAGETGAADAAEVKELISMVQAEGLKNPGTGVTQDLKFHIKFSRQNGIHVSPTTTLNGLVFDSSSSWGLEEWQDVLDPYL